MNDFQVVGYRDESEENQNHEAVIYEGKDFLQARLVMANERHEFELIELRNGDQVVDVQLSCRPKV